MIGMANYPDKYFDLAIVDPPYGIGIMKQWGSAENDYRQFEVKDWDNNTPDERYFKELFRVSKNQIVWGGNYFTEFLPPSMGWALWDKGQREFTLADGELAWTSFQRALRIYTLHRSNKNNPDRIHICQKPVKLYRWLLKNYANAGDKILDTHLGSQSSRIAAYDLGFDFYGWEIDEDYFADGCKRFEMFKSQLKLQFA